MKRLIIIITIVWGLFLIGCTNGEMEVGRVDNSEDEGYKLSMEDINANYNDNIINITTYKEKYVLVESSEETFANKFELYNLETGDRDVLPTNPYYVKLDKIENENTFIFLADGRNHISPHHEFPFELECVRYDQVANREDDFKMIRRPVYYKLDESVTFGSKDKEIVTDIRVTLEGIQVLFGPMEGYEMDFYAGDTMLPEIETSFSKDKNQFILRLNDVKKGKKLDSENYKQSNYFIESIEIQEKDDHCLIILQMKESAQFYYGNREDTLQDKGYPYLELKFLRDVY